MKKNLLSKLLAVFLTLLLCFCIITSFVPAVASREPFAPTWMKEGVYVKYNTNREGNALIFNVSNPKYKGLNCWDIGALDSLRFWNATLIWHCISTNETTAKLQVTFDCIGKMLIHYGEEATSVSLNNTRWQLTGEVYVDLYNRTVYTADGLAVGTTHMWLTSNPSEGQEVVVWDMPPEKVTLPAKVNGVTFETVQGIKDCFLIEGTPSIRGKPRNFLLFCDLQTGLTVGGMFNWDPIFAAIGISDVSLDTFSETNIQLGRSDSSFNWAWVLQYSVLPIAIILLCVTAIYRFKKKQGRARF
ncbi:MAG: hypothetical protein ACPLIG_03910 [Candidatus Bathyarchaeales archaeon]